MASVMNHSLITSELVKTIQEDRLLQAQQRRERSRRLIRGSRRQTEMMRMAIGPGTQFGGVTERVLDTVTDRGRSAKAA
jgi:hypothetical protein